jgi:Ser/Thr protein kinase RdoA (MazF antagonist)
MPELSGIQRAIFGTESASVVRDWLDDHLREQLSGAIDDITFQTGAIGAVFGLRLADGRDVVLKALRPGGVLARQRAVVDCQNRLAAAGFGAPTVLDGPTITRGVVAVVEERLTCTSTGAPHAEATRAAMAGGLARQIELLRAVDGSALIDGRPAWADWDSGAWPEPHDSIFDFTTQVAGYEWIDTTAEAAAKVLQTAGALPAVIGHSDWVWQNVCVRDDQFVAGYDWDSLIYAPESAVVGLIAGSFTQGSPEPPQEPYADEVTAFIGDYQRVSGRQFDDHERQIAAAAANWVRCYNARCHLDNRERRGIEPHPGSFIDQSPAERGC